MSDDEPSLLAQEIMADIVAGRRRVIPDRDVARLSEYECLAIDRAVWKSGEMRRDASKGEFIFDGVHSTGYGKGD